MPSSGCVEYTLFDKVDRVDMDTGDKENKANSGIRPIVESDIVYEAYPNAYRVSLCTYIPKPWHPINIHIHTR